MRLPAVILCSHDSAPLSLSPRPGHKAGVRSPPEIRAGGHAPRERLPTAAHHRLLHPEPGAQEDPGEDAAHAVRRQKPGLRREVGQTLCHRKGTDSTVTANHIF